MNKREEINLVFFVLQKTVEIQTSDEGLQDQFDSAIGLLLFVIDRLSGGQLAEFLEAQENGR